MSYHATPGNTIKHKTAFVLLTLLLLKLCFAFSLQNGVQYEKQAEFQCSSPISYEW